MILWGKDSNFIDCTFETIKDKTHWIPIQRDLEVWMKRRHRELRGECKRGFPTQRRSHSPLSPNVLEKQFSKGYDKNNMSIISLKIASFYKLENGRSKGKRGETQTSRTWTLLEVPPGHPWLRGSCLFGQ